MVEPGIGLGSLAGLCKLADEPAMTAIGGFGEMTVACVSYLTPPVACGV